MTCYSQMSLYCNLNIFSFISVILQLFDFQDRLLEYYMKDHPLFSENFVNWFVNQTLDELIPDVMIEALNDIGRMVCNSHVHLASHIYLDRRTIY